ncbi:MAG: putative succinyl-diaminopimelate desuccinylase [Alphaproteobacteria bacterium MarineAlpha9_Bin3]|nr:MAG: putative succinyl-diaminopimelate desuccinylase [Alphaproteobacteria bacterium MarineAlpha9_Bin3]
MKVNIYIFIFFIILSYSYKSFSTELSEEAYNWLKEFISIDTVNPPGNEINAVNFYKNIFIKENIDFNQAESSPNRGNIWARIKGGNKPALILLQHTDVVPANKENWTVDPFKPTEINNYLYGRGTLDMKGTGISQLATFLHLKRAGKKLNRDIIFLATADEEAGGNYGVGWLIQKHPEIFKNVGFLLNEGGSGRIVNDKLVFEIELTQKVPVWLRFESEGKPGHGSSPYESSSVTRLLDGLQHLKNNPFPPKIIPSVGDYFQGLSKIVNEEYSNEYKDIKKSIKKEEFIKALQKRSPFHHSLTRDTCSITRLGASNKINVVPPLAWAEIDCRILPDQPAEEFIFKITKMMEPFGIKVKKLMAFTPASSSIDTEFYKIIRSTLLNLYPEAHIIPRVTTGFTDSHFTRDIGINSYGFNPIIIPLVEFRRIHGNDERVNINAFKTSIYDHLKIIENFVYD